MKKSKTDDTLNEGAVTIHDEILELSNSVFECSISVESNYRDNSKPCCSKQINYEVILIHHFIFYRIYIRIQKLLLGTN